MFYYYYHFLKLLSLLFQAKWWTISRERETGRFGEEIRENGLRMGLKMAESCICVLCKVPINDSFVMKVGLAALHESCLKCHTCGCSLTHTCFLKTGHFYCKQDFYHIFGPRYKVFKSTNPKVFYISDFYLLKTMVLKSNFL